MPINNYQNLSNQKYIAPSSLHLIKHLFLKNIYIYLYFPISWNFVYYKTKIGSNHHINVNKNFFFFFWIIIFNFDVSRYWVSRAISSLLFAVSTAYVQRTITTRFLIHVIYHENSYFFFFIESLNDLHIFCLWRYFSSFFFVIYSRRMLNYHRSLLFWKFLCQFLQSNFFSI